MIKSLEERLREAGKIEEFKESSSGLESELKDITETLFGIACLLEQRDLSENYVIYGGYAVLLQFINSIDNVKISAWRGSYDLDIVGDESVVETIKQNYPVISDRKSEKVKGKRTLRIKTADTKKTIKIDIRQKEAFNAKPEAVYVGDVDKIKLYGFNLNVISPVRQLKNKLSVSRKLDRDKYDIITLLGILYIRDAAPKKIADYLSLQERSKLYNLLKGQQIESILNEKNIIYNIVQKTEYSDYLKQIKICIKKRGI